MKRTILIFEKVHNGSDGEEKAILAIPEDKIKMVSSFAVGLEEDLNSPTESFMVNNIEVKGDINEFLKRNFMVLKEFNIKIMEKQRLYRSAFSPKYDIFVSISDSYKDRGKWFFVCSSGYHKNPNKRFTDTVFREDELKDFVL